MPKANNVFQNTFETINQASGGVAAGVATALKDQVQAVGKGLKQAPIDIFASLVGVDPDKAGKGGEDPGIEDLSGSTDPNDPQATSQAQGSFAERLEKKEKARRLHIRQQQMMLQQYQSQYEKTKQDEEQKKQQDDKQKEHKKVQIKQLEQRKQQEALAVTNAKQIGGTGEVDRKKGM